MKRVSRSPRAHKANKFIKTKPTKLAKLFKQHSVGQQVLINLDPALNCGMIPYRLINTGLVGTVVKLVDTPNLDKFYVVKVNKKYYTIYSGNLDDRI